ncbi:hypothetical protein AVEN_114316-1 [Araneus ventricosus]|uniref:Uncharacterized protein n=1 Tax=Araneus ventricosus TaxID=182803 RepID=A0A4Y2IVS2_ARAVE|nr:hypothetical protein AVEN_114316-1 [Araneus ventricosus]
MQNDPPEDTFHEMLRLTRVKKRPFLAPEFRFGITNCTSFVYLLISIFFSLNTLPFRSQGVVLSCLLVIFVLKLDKSSNHSRAPSFMVLIGCVQPRSLSA